jgi:hypothetical protein
MLVQCRQWLWSSLVLINKVRTLSSLLQALGSTACTGSLYTLHILVSTNAHGACCPPCHVAAGGYSTGYEHDPKEKAKYTDADNANFNP